MFDVAPTELLLVIIVAVAVIGPKDLPRVARTVGNWVGKARGMARHFRSGLDTMMREAELEELEKQWREHNEAIMRAYPRFGPASLGPAPGTVIDGVATPVAPVGPGGALPDLAADRPAATGPVEAASAPPPPAPPAPVPPRD